ncbi:hypothetical protein P691DRAFT_738710, partial [Macrolepiota fuliginosa MF-IS2]
MDEQYRTVWSLLVNCLSVVFTCTWTAMHVNMPGPNCQGIMRHIKKLEAMFYAILVPEAVLFWAWRQYRGARNLAKTYNNDLNLDSAPPFEWGKKMWNYLSASADPMDPQWTITHGFYVQMGGFVLYEGDELICVLTCKDLIQLVQNGDADPPMISEDEIMDKSKGSLFSKIVNIVGISVFILVFFRRLFGGLGHTHLELGTLCICILAVLISLIWLKKPLDVE